MKADIWRESAVLDVKIISVLNKLGMYIFHGEIILALLVFCSKVKVIMDTYLENTLRTLL